MYLEKEDQILSSNIQMHNKIARLFTIKVFDDLITINFDNQESFQLLLNPKVLTLFLELLEFLNLENLIKIADSFNLKKEQDRDRKLSLFISHNNEIINLDTNYCYDNPGHINLMDDDSFDDCIIIDFVESKPVCIMIKITYTDSLDNSKNYVRYTLPITTENELDGDHRYVVNGIAKVHNVSYLEEDEDFFEEYEEVEYDNNITIKKVLHIQNTSTEKVIVAMVSNDKSYLPDLN